MLLSGHQPVYLPGIILFNKIALSDAFMVVGHCQYSNKSWHNRNYIRLGGQRHLLTVPVRKADRFGQPINDTEILDDGWKKKHIGSIRQAYRTRPFFDRYFPELEAILARPARTLGALNTALIRAIAGWLGLETPFLDSRDHAITGHKTDMLIAMCRAAGADRYLSNEGARVYVDERAMFDCGIRHCWQVFTHPVYDQGAPFEPNLSVIDLLFNIGPAAGALVRGCGTVQPGAWADLAGALPLHPAWAAPSEPLPQ